MTMDVVIEREAETDLKAVPPLLFVVWIDTNLGDLNIAPDFGPDWEINSHPKPLGPALDEAAWCRAHDFPSVVLPEGQTPRIDGLFTNPDTKG